MGSLTNFDELVSVATDGQSPYMHQRRLAEEGLAEVVELPTGAGKTHIALAWLYRRRFHSDKAVRAATPHWLVFCLPMRVLVEQVRDRIGEWVGRLGLTSDDLGIHVVMGGDGKTDGGWRYRPDRDAIFIGTQDMLLSRALNRGYGDGRFLWPVDFGFFNAGAHWVFDEVQLMGPGLPTSRQLQGLRDALGTAGRTSSTWMSATVDEAALRTVDNRELGTVVTVDEHDRQGMLGARLSAPKRMERIDVDPRRPADLAAVLGARHVPGTLTLAVCNTVDRAVELFRALRKLGLPAPAVLVHSRFRPPERKAALDFALAKPDADGPGLIVVSTQVVEAGVDISATTLYTEAAPWSSIVQRAGRCNRFGEQEEQRRAVVLWSRPLSANPYEPADVDAAATQLDALEGTTATPESLGAIRVPTAPVFHPVLRRRDVLELFDTLPDLTDNDLDVSRFIRDADDLDAFVGWRDLGGKPPAEEALRPLTRDERCPVPVAALRKELPPAGAWRLDHLSGDWVRCREADVRPGLVVLLDSSVGKYDPVEGWSPRASTRVEPLLALDADDRIEGDRAVGDDPATVHSKWYSLATHLLDVERHARQLLSGLDTSGLDAGDLDAAIAAARLHDIGKAHPAFQGMLLSCAGDDEGERAAAEAAGRPLAKSGGHGRGRYEELARKPFRHELVSALALLEGATGRTAKNDNADLIAYLVAAHHGRIRMGFRPLPTEEGGHVAFGVVDGDAVPLDEIDGLGLLPVSLSLDSMRLGGGEPGGSWATMALGLRDRLGPFRLAFLEAVVRSADWRASAEADRAEAVSVDVRP
jgi:CRISPR-associated endonuclease/helicase Cas3